MVLLYMRRLIVGRLLARWPRPEPLRQAKNMGLLSGLIYDQMGLSGLIYEKMGLLSNGVIIIDSDLAWDYYKVFILSWDY